MENLELYQLVILLLAVAYAAFRVGRATAPGNSEEARMLARVNAEDLFAKLPADAQTAVDERIRNGKIIEAVKIIRENTGAGLKESKQAVDMRKAAIGPL